MTIKQKNIIKSLSQKPVFNLSGKEGNAISIIGFVRSFAETYPNKISNPDEIVRLMLAGDHDNLVNTFKKHFNKYLDIRS